MIHNEHRVGKLNLKKYNPFTVHPLCNGCSIAFQESRTLSALHLQESFGCRLCQETMSYFNIFQAVYSANVGYVCV